MASTWSDSLSQRTAVSPEEVQIPPAQVEQNGRPNEAAQQTDPDSNNESFHQEIKDYQQQLELEFQTFERSLNERDTSAELESLDWHELEERYKKEIQPHIDAEQDIINEFGARFQVQVHHNVKLSGG